MLAPGATVEPETGSALFFTVVVKPLIAGISTGTSWETTLVVETGSRSEVVLQPFSNLAWLDTRVFASSPTTTVNDTLVVPPCAATERFVHSTRFFALL